MKKKGNTGKKKGQTEKKQKRFGKKTKPPKKQQRMNYCFEILKVMHVRI